jgi:hypothetical protein
VSRQSGRSNKSGDKRSDEELIQRITLIDTLLKNIETKISTQANASLGDFIRLLQLKRELEAEMPRDIRVSWVDQ